MSNLFDTLNEKTNGWLGKAKDTAVELGAKGKAAAESAIEKGRVKAAELKLNNQLKNAFLELGEATYEQMVNGTEFEGRDELLDKITSLKQTLADLLDNSVEEECCECEECAEETCECCCEEEPAGEACECCCEEEPAGETCECCCEENAE